MKNHRMPVVIMFVSLVAVAIIAAQTFERSLGAKELRQANVAGLADLNRVEVQPRAITGFADLNRVDSPKQAAANSAGSSQIASQTGRITGFADLNRVEGQAILPQTGATSTQAPGRVCPHLSTPSGERDAGASAPAYVLQAMGCPVDRSE